jgi:DNA-directed RNA polymerase specialized sigma24 family protein
MSAADFYRLYLADPSEINLGRLLMEVRRIALSESRRLGAKRHEADDHAQATSLKVWTRLVSGQSIKSITAYVKSATRHIVYSHHRHINSSKCGGLITESLDVEP